MGVLWEEVKEEERGTASTGEAVRMREGGVGGVRGWSGRCERVEWEVREGVVGEVRASSNDHTKGKHCTLYKDPQ